LSKFYNQVVLTSSIAENPLPFTRDIETNVSRVVIVIVVAVGVVCGAAGEATSREIVSVPDILQR